MIRTIPAALRAAERRCPGLRPIILAAWGFVWRPIFRLILLPFRFPQGRGAPVEPPGLAERTTTYNEAAERYYAEYADPRFLLDKPFSDAQQFGRYLVNTGTLIAGAKLRPGDTVVEFGAGTCWLSHFLNRFGCRTIALDVSGTALTLGRQLFESDPRTNWSLDPRFVPYDGAACKTLGVARLGAQVLLVNIVLPGSRPRMRGGRTGGDPRGGNQGVRGFPHRALETPVGD